MSSNFGTPTFGAPSTSASSTTTAPNGAANPGPATALPPDTPQDLIDPNDPRLVSENIDVNVAGDAYAQPAPPPDAKYRAKLKLEGVKDDKGQVHPYLAKLTKRPPILPYYFTSISAHIIDPSGKYDDVPVFDSWVGTFQGRDGSSKVSTILARLKRPDGQPWVQPGVRMSQKEWMELFVRALSGEPEIGVETQWEWSCEQCGKDAKAAGKDYPKSITGMAKFPAEQDAAKLKAGQRFSPEMACRTNAGHGYSRARATIARFLALGELK